MRGVQEVVREASIQDASPHEQGDAKERLC